MELGLGIVMHRVKLCGLVVLLCLCGKWFYGESWNVPGGTYRVWVGHTQLWVTNRLGEEGIVAGEVDRGDNFLQYTAFSGTYSPVERFHGKVSGFMEREKDAWGRSISSVIGESFESYHVNGVRMDAHWGFDYGVVTRGVGIYYQAPIRDLGGDGHLFGMNVAGYYEYGRFRTTFTFLGEGSLKASFLRGDGMNVFFLGKVESFTPLSVLGVHWGIMDMMEVHAGVEGVVSSWHYLKGIMGVYIILGGGFKVDVHYIRTFFGRWVLPSHGVSMGVEFGLSL